MAENVRLARMAMNTRFELVLEGEDPVRLRAAGEAALDEIDRIEAQLSLFRPTSEVGRANARAGREPVVVSPPVFALLEQCRDLWRLTDGTFDITVAPLMQVWGFRGRAAGPPSEEAVAAVREQVGMQHLDLDPNQRTVRFARPGMRLDLGAVGKGYAIDLAVEWLREAGVERAFLHGGTSTSYGLGTPAGQSGWKAAVTLAEEETEPGSGGEERSSARPRRLLATVDLQDASLSVSELRGRAIQAGGRIHGHVLDPRRGVPVTGAWLAAVTGGSATETDALSTALLVLGEAGVGVLGGRREEPGLLVATPGEGGGWRVRERGFRRISETG